MRESGYYPPGAEFDPNAPWNQSEPPEIDIEVTVKETLSKDTSVVTNNAWYVTDEEGCRYLEDENFCPTDEYEKQNDLLSVVIAKAREEITKLRIEAEKQQRKLEAHYGVRHGCIPGYYLPDIPENERWWHIKRREQLCEASKRVRQLKALEDGLDGWEQEDIEVEQL